VSILIFGLGAGFSFYEGINHFQNPKAIETPKWNFIVLGIAFLLDSTSFTIAFKAFRRENKEHNFWKAVKTSKNPATFVVLFEDAADVLGIITAFAGVYLSHRLNNPYYDAMASMVIGIILTVVSIFLTKESRSLLMGETPSNKLLEGVISVAENNPDIQKVKRHLSMVLGPEEFLVILLVQFNRHLTAEKISHTIEKLKSDIQNKYPGFKKIFVEAD
jgi:cation diffusion facilitator family transporter